MAVCDIGGGMDSQARLARAPGACESYESILFQNGSQFGELGVAADQGRELGREVVGEGVEGAQPRELVVQVGMAELPHSLRSPEVLQAVRTQVAEIGVVGKAVCDKVSGGAGQNGLAAVGDPPQAGAADHRPPYVVVVAP